MIVGHQKIINFFDKAVKAGSFSHAYIFTGPEHLGKFAVALNFIEKISGRIRDDNQNVIIVRPETEEKNGKMRRKDITVKSVRALQRKLSLMSDNGKIKSAVIDNAEYLNKQAQNAMLKMLEEPPMNVILILIVHDFSKILPTIKSRCEVKKFFPVSDKELKGMIPPEHDARQKIIFWSLGRPGLAKIYLENELELKEKDENADELRKLFSKNLTERFFWAETAGKDSIRLLEKLSLWLIIIRQSILGNSRFLTISQEKALKLSDKIIVSMRHLRETNSNPRLILENLMLEL